MASITLKDIPEDLHAQLKREGEANFRTTAQEVLARVQASFDLEDRSSTETVNRLIDEALASGEPKEYSAAAMKARFDQTRQHTRKRLAAEKKAA
jgi:hypothetical protein